MLLKLSMTELLFFKDELFLALALSKGKGIKLLAGKHIFD